MECLKNYFIRIFVVILILLPITSTQGGLPQEIDLGQGQGQIEFKAIGRPSALKVIGKGAVPQGRLTLTQDIVTGTARFNLNTLDTGIILRNHHMLEKYLETGKYPEAQLKLAPLSLPKASQGDTFQLENLPFSGVLQLHGVTQSVSGTVSLELKNGILQLNAQFDLKITPFKIELPTFAGITVADEVKVSVIESIPLQSPTSSQKR